MKSGRAPSENRMWLDSRAPQRAFLEAVMELAGDGLWDWNIKTGDVAFSPSWFRNLGYEPGELAPHVTTWKDLVHPEDIPRVEAALARHFAGETPRYECVNRLRMRSGAYRWNVDRGKVIEWDSDGHPLRMVGFDVDVSARWAAEEELREMRDALRALYDITTGTEPQFSAQIQALLSMGCERFGLPTGILARVDGDRYEVMEGVGLPPGAERGDVFPLGETYCRDTLTAQEPVLFEHGGASKWKSHPCYVRFRLEAYVGIPVRVNNKIFGTLNFSSPQPHEAPFRPMDEQILKLMAQWVGGELGRLQLQGHLLEQGRLATIGTTASTLAHEIGNPLNALMLNAHLLAKDLERDEGERNRNAMVRVTAMVREIRRLSGLLDEFRSLSQRQSISPEPVDLPAILRHVLKVLDPELADTGVRVDEQFVGGSEWVLGDPNRLTQLFMNLSRNAAEAMPDGGTLSLATLPSADHVRIEIRDTGVGIPEGSNVFEPFHTTKPRGTGLGLAVAKQIAEAHGGAIWWESSPGCGTSFFVSLPIAPVDALPG